MIERKKIHNFVSFNIYATKKGKLKNYNLSLLKNIKNLASYHGIHTFSQAYVGQIVGPVHEGFWRVGHIYLKNTDDIQFQKDCEYIKENYSKLLTLQ